MQNFDAFESYQVLGKNLQNIAHAFGSFSLLASQIMIEEELGTDDGEGKARFEPERWYPLKNNLRAFERIRTEFGESMLREMASVVPRIADFPPTVKDVHSALASLDVAYHMNHGKGDAPLFVPATGQMREGIGHYLFKPVEGQKQIRMECTTPYPCVFDQALVHAMAQRFAGPTAQTTHDKSAPCRSKGGVSCTYVVTWR